MHGHLVAVEVRVVGGADQGVQLDGLAFHQQGLKGLDAQAVQGGRAVEQMGYSRTTSSRMSQTTSSSRSTIFLALLMVEASSRSSSLA
jgi:hypothetical protein